MHALFLRLVVFSSGMSVLAAELAASRLTAPYFGTSLVVWANVIGLTLLYLTLGYVLGGRWADAHPRARVLYAIVLLGAASIVLLPFVGPAVLSLLLRSFAPLSGGLIVGSFLGLLVLLAAPVTLLGMVSPFAIRLLVTDVRTSGGVAGRIYALSTVGSILGTLLPVLWTIPVWGTRNTFLAFGGWLVLLSVIGLALERR